MSGHAPALAIALLSAAAAAAAPPPAGEGFDPAAAQETAIAEAEAALRVGELQTADSRLRGALAEGWLVRGALDVADGRLDDAVDAFRRAAASAVETRRARASLAAVHLRRGETAEAVDLLRRLAGDHPADLSLRKLLAQALVVAGETGEAAQELEEAYALTGDPEIAFALANGYLRLGRVERAEALFAEVAAARPVAATWVLIGRTYRDHQHDDRAREALERALAMDPAARRASFYLGTLEVLAFGRDGFDAAAERFRVELEHHPDDLLVQFYYGLVLAEQRRFEAALPHLEAAAGWDPIRLDALRFAGRCRLALGRVDDAVATLLEALALAEADGVRPRQRETVHYQLAQALRRRGDEAGAAEHFAAAEGQLARVVADERSELELLITGGPQGAGAVDLDTATATAAPLAVPELDALPRAARDTLRERVETALARTDFNLGVGHLRAGRFERALVPLEAAEELRPDFPGLQRSLGAARFNAGRFAEAAAALERAAAAEPGDRGLEGMLAMAWLNGDEPGRAADLLGRVLDADPGRADDRALQFAYGLALVRSGSAAEAEAAFGRLLAEHDDWPELHVVLGQAHAQQGDFEAAVAELERALELRPDVPEASFTLGDLYFRQGRLEEAERALRTELSYRPGDLAARYHLAVVLDLENQPEAATGELETLLAARPDHADGRYLLGKIRLAQGAAEEASAQLEAAAGLAPEDANIRYQLAQAYQRSGRPELAEEQLAVYRDLKRRQGGRR